jgi:hypothetical protein
MLWDIIKKIEEWDEKIENKCLELERKALNGKTVYEKQAELIGKVKEKCKQSK